MTGLTLARGEARRDRGRLLLLLAAVALLLFLAGFLQSLVATLQGRFTGALRHQSGAVLVLSAASQRNIEDSQLSPTVIRAVGATQGIAESAPLAEGAFTLRVGGKLQRVVLIGYQPRAAGEPQPLLSGRRAVTVGEAVASTGIGSSGLSLGDTAQLEPGGIHLHIVGVLSGAELAASPTLFVPYQTFVAAAHAADPAGTGAPVSALAVDPRPGLAANTLAQRISRTVPQVTALTRGQAAADSPEVTATTNSLGVILFLAELAVVVVIAFFFALVVTQRRPSLALLRAVGVPSRALAGSLLTQAVLVVLLAALVGGVATAAAGHIGGTLSYQMAVSRYLTTAGLALALAVIAASVVLRRVLRVEPVEAMRAIR